MEIHHRHRAWRAAALATWADSEAVLPAHAHGEKP